MPASCLNIFLAMVVTLSTAVLLKAQPYEPTWESLSAHTPAPEWFRDAKFGIYFHWGVYSVPAFGNEWYPHHMHKPDHKVGQHHLEKYGDPAEYGYDRFVEGFTAEHFDADEWMDLFVKAGARFAGPVAEHHDGFALWASKTTPWNAQDRGPKRDLVKELEVAARKRGLKYVATFHHARNRLWQKETDQGLEWHGHYMHAKRNHPRAFDDAERAFLYGDMPKDEFYDMWFTKLKEVIDSTSPDLIWFDSWLDTVPDETKRKFLAYYLNHAAENDKEVVVTYKQEDLPQNIGVLDLEKGGMGDLTEFSWLTDDTISLGSWCYTDALRIKEPHVVVHNLIDIVSKNGQLILNVSPTADGKIPQDQRDVLLALGEWLDKYGEAIFETRPFHTYGHGPTATRKGHFGGIATDKGYTSEDIRYTTKGDVVYAIQLGEAVSGEQVLLTGFSEGTTGKVTSVDQLGSDAKVEWSMTNDGLAVTPSGASPDTIAVVYKITTATK